MVSSKFVYLSSALLVLAYFSQAAPQDSYFSEFYKDTIATIKSLEAKLPDDLTKEKLYVTIKDVAQKSSDKLQDSLKKFEKDSKSYGADFQQRYEALQKQVAELSKSVGSKEFLGKSEKFYDSIEQQSKELSLKAAEALKSQGLPEQQQAQLKQFIEATAEISAKVQEKVSEVAKQYQKP